MTNRFANMKTIPGFAAAAAMVSVGVWGLMGTAQADTPAPNPTVSDSGAPQGPLGGFLGRSPSGFPGFNAPNVQGPNTAAPNLAAPNFNVPTFTIPAFPTIPSKVTIPNFPTFPSFPTIPSKVTIPNFPTFPTFPTIPSTYQLPFWPFAIG